ncbi:MAG: Mobile element protein, partial [Olavius algarvensis Gamma 1 endosymbiont]
CMWTSNTCLRCRTRTNARICS